MAKNWMGSDVGRAWTRSPPWRIWFDAHDIMLDANGQQHRASALVDSSIRIHEGLIWTDVTLFPGSAEQVQVDGLPNAEGRSLKAELHALRADYQHQSEASSLVVSHRVIQLWLQKIMAAHQEADQKHRWLTHETQQALIHLRPVIDGQKLLSSVQNPAVQKHLGHNAGAIEKSLGAWKGDWPRYWQTRNDKHVLTELEACNDLLSKVERTPLTQEQAKAVLCFDNRVQVVASAGSGKTSTMVAKAAYAIHRQIVAPDRIIMLAFNENAATELKERARQSFDRLDMPDVQVAASTFHALGLRIIGKATGEKPDVPTWAADNAAGLEKLAELVDQLKDQSLAFRADWDMFRLVFGKDLPAFGKPSPPDAWDSTGRSLNCTLRGERVRSLEEVIIANWLFYNGVAYEYERQHEIKTVDAEHRQYKPDFYYPDIQLYHEHFALDAKGQPPPNFANYLDGVKWKRQFHAQQKTSLIETTSHQIRTGAVFDHLSKELTSRGIQLDPNPDRQVPDGGQKPMEHGELIGLVRTFMSHAKSNGLTVDALHARLKEMPEAIFKFRHRMFLRIAAPVMQAWDAALAREGGIDFEDMLNQAADHLESGRYDAQYELVMADEFQDASRARARLCRALVQKPGRYLFAVGDDWQSINRFAGADVSVMTGFRQWFGHGQVLKLEQTFRCPQALCDVTSQFISKNDAQIKKKVHSKTPAVGAVLEGFEVDDANKIQSAIAEYLERLCTGLQAGTVPTVKGRKISVFVLGRYRADQAYVPVGWQAQFGRWITLQFLTVHRSKGSEADYVILPAMVSRFRGNSFPNTRTDDPVLALAMPSGDTYPLGEERRLFYVALTRARRSVAMFTVRGQRSSFLEELAKDGALTVVSRDGQAIETQPCPGCNRGVIVTRNGRYGEFQSCSNYPACHYKPAKKYSNAKRPPTRR